MYDTKRTVGLVTVQILPESTEFNEKHPLVKEECWQFIEDLPEESREIFQVRGYITEPTFDKPSLYFAIRERLCCQG